MHAVNTVGTSLTEVTDEKVSLFLQVIFSFLCIVAMGYRRLGLYLLNETTLMYEGVTAHVQVGEGFACKVSILITELVVTSCDDAAILEIQGVTNGKLGVAAVAVI